MGITDLRWSNQHKKLPVHQILYGYAGCKSSMENVFLAANPCHAKMQMIQPGCLRRPGAEKISMHYCHKDKYDWVN